MVMLALDARGEVGGLHHRPVIVAAALEAVVNVARHGAVHELHLMEYHDGVDPVREVNTVGDRSRSRTRTRGSGPESAPRWTWTGPRTACQRTKPRRSGRSSGDRPIACHSVRRSPSLVCESSIASAMYLYAATGLVQWAVEATAAVHVLAVLALVLAPRGAHGGALNVLLHRLALGGVEAPEAEQHLHLLLLAQVGQRVHLLHLLRLGLLRVLLHPAMHTTR
ncbi:hypothetical protein ON010_g18946 [Phytophthora cinnamomi]|nr:hypothetical protein ON010_g18946 [Phytophthora cinnamomi]